MIDLGAGTDTARGGDGNDIISGGKGGIDTIDGGPGDDVIYGGSGIDKIDCGDGNDTVFISTPGEGGDARNCEVVIYGDPAADDPTWSPLTGRVNAGLLVGGQALANRASPAAPFTTAGPRGTEGPDRMAGTNGVDILIGLGVNDTMYGFDGDDDFDGGAGNDTLEVGAGNDKMFLVWATTPPTAAPVTTSSGVRPAPTTCVGAKQRHADAGQRPRSGLGRPGR